MPHAGASTLRREICWRVRTSWPRFRDELARDALGDAPLTAAIVAGAEDYFVYMTEPVGGVFPHMGLVELRAFTLETGIEVFVTNVTDGGTTSFSVVDGYVVNRPRNPLAVSLRLRDQHWTEVDNESIRQSLNMDRTSLLEFTGMVQVRSEVRLNIIVCLTWGKIPGL